jgi:hypothetical protein
MTGIRTRLAHFLSRVGAVARLWLGGGLTTRQVVRLAMRVGRFERWGVRPITQARFARLVAAADAPRPDASAAVARLREMEAEHRIAVQAAADAQAALADTRALAGRTAARALAMQRSLETAVLKTRHLEEIAAAYRALVEGGEAVWTEHGPA